MTDRISAFIVTLKEPLREPDDAKAVAEAIAMIGPVATVEGVVHEPFEAQAAEQFIRARVSGDLFDLAARIRRGEPIE